MPRCNHCGFINSENSKNCEKCNTPLASSASTGNRRISLKFDNMVPEQYAIENGVTIYAEDEQFTISEFIGEGGFANVYKLKNSQNQTFALKILNAYKLMPQELSDIAKRFNLEYEIASTIQSDHTVKAYRRGKINGNPFYIMDYSPGGTLSKQLKLNLTESKINSIAVKVLHGLNDMHQKGYIHRDLKPDNILFNQYGNALLADFGISAYLNNRFTARNWLNGKVNEVWGTVQYMAPEQLKDVVKYTDTGNFTDIFAFGVTLYETVTQGKMPFGDFQSFVGNPSAYVAKVRKGNWTDIKKYKPNVSPTIEKVIYGCLQPDISNRYKDTKEIIALFGNVTHSIPNIPIIEQKPLRGNIILKVMYGEDPDKKYNLTQISRNKNKKLLTLGWFDKTNPSANDIGIVENITQWISRRHATFALLKIEANGEQVWFVQDGQFYEKAGVKKMHLSTNGVFVNSIRITTNGIRIKCGDIIMVGETTLRVEVE